MPSTYMSLATPRPARNYGSLYANPTMSASHSKLQAAPFLKDPLKSQSHHGSSSGPTSLKGMVRKSASSSGIAALLANSQTLASEERVANARFSDRKTKRRERRIQDEAAIEDGLGVGLRLSGGLPSKSKNSSKSKSKHSSRTSKDSRKGLPGRQISHQSKSMSRREVSSTSKTIRKSKSFGDVELDREKRAYLLKAANTRSPVSKDPEGIKTPALKRIPRRQLSRKNKIASMLHPLNQSMASLSAPGTIVEAEVKTIRKSKSLGNSEADRAKRLNMKKLAHAPSGRREQSPVLANRQRRSLPDGPVRRRNSLSTARRQHHSEGSLDFSEDLRIQSESTHSSKGAKKGSPDKSHRRRELKGSQHKYQSERSLRVYDLDRAGSNHSSTRRPRGRVSLQKYLDHHTSSVVQEVTTLVDTLVELTPKESGLDSGSSHKNHQKGTSMAALIIQDKQGQEKATSTIPKTVLDRRSSHGRRSRSQGRSKRTGRRNSLRNMNDIAAQHLEQSIVFEQQQQEEEEEFRREVKARLHQQERKVRRRASLGQAMEVLASAAPQPIEGSLVNKHLEFSSADALKLRALKALAVPKAPEGKLLSDSSHSTASFVDAANTNTNSLPSTDLAAEKRRRILELGESFRLIHDEKHSMLKEDLELTREVPMLMGSYVWATAPSDSSTIESQPSLHLMELASSFSDLFGK